jgi:hypothetical protein
MLSLPVLSSLTELLTGTVTDEFKKLIQPASLVAAAIFMALNLVLIFPPLIAHRIAPAVALEALPAAWQIALGTLTLFALGYLINSLGGFFLDVLNGNAFRKSPLVYAWLRECQKRVFTNLQKKLNPPESGAEPDSNEQARAAYQLAYEFPREETELAPTSLGNILLSGSSYIWHQYGVHLDTIWSAMSLVLKEDEELSKRLREGRDALTFLASLMVLLLVVAIELVVVGSVLLQPLHAILGVPAILLAAYAVYRAAAHKAMAWSRDVRTAFDLYLDAVAEGKLKLKPLPLQKFEDRKDRWKAVSRWLAYGATDLTPFPSASQVKDWYPAVPPDPPVFEVQHPPTVSVEKQCMPRRCSSKDLDNPDTKWYFGQIADYLFFVTNTESGEHALPAVGIGLLVTDSRLSVEQKIEGKLDVGCSSQAKNKGSSTITAKWHPSKPPALFWSLGDIPARSTCTLCYTARHEDEVIVEVKQAKGEQADSKFKIESLCMRDDLTTIAEVGIRNEGKKARITVIVWLPKDTGLPEVPPIFEVPPAYSKIETGQIQTEKNSDEQEIRWTPLEPIPAKTSFIIRFTREP